MARWGRGQRGLRTHGPASSRSGLRFLWTVCVVLLSYGDLRATEAVSPLLTSSREALNGKAFKCAAITTAEELSYYNPFVRPKAAHLQQVKDGFAAQASAGFAAVEMRSGEVDGFHPRLLNDMALDAGFTYTVDFVQVEGPEFPDLFSKVEELFNNKDYDCILSGIEASVDLKNVASHILPTLNISFEVISKVTIDTPSATSRIFTFLQPFSAGVWLVTLAILVVVALELMWFESGTSNEFPRIVSTRNFVGVLGLTMYKVYVSFAAVDWINPRTLAARVLLMALCSMSLIMIAIYTANLAAFLTVARSPTAGISSITDLQASPLPACIRSHQADREIAERFGLTVLETGPDYADMLHAIEGGECDGAIGVGADLRALLHYEGKKGNFCDLMMVGTPLSYGFVVLPLNPGLGAEVAALDVVFAHIIFDYDLLAYIDQEFPSAPSVCAAGAAVNSSASLFLQDVAGVMILMTCTMGSVAILHLVLHQGKDGCWGACARGVPVEPAAGSPRLPLVQGDSTTGGGGTPSVVVGNAAGKMQPYASGVVHPEGLNATGRAPSSTNGLSGHGAMLRADGSDGKMTLPSTPLDAS